VRPGSYTAAMPTARDPLYQRHRFHPEVISHAVWLYFRFPLSLRMVEEMLATRGICVTYETVRQWGKKFGKAFAEQIRQRAPARGDKWGGDKSSSKSYAKVERIRNSCGPPQPSWKAKRSETFRQMLLAIPGVDAGQIDVLPAQRRDVFQQRVWNVSSCSLQVRDRAVDIDSIPVYDRTNDEIETGGAEGLTLERSVTDFATLVEEDGAFEFVRSLALVESSLTAPAQCRARIPFDHEQRSLDAA
jgi:hypothetical protein